MRQRSTFAFVVVYLIAALLGAVVWASAGATHTECAAAVHQADQ